MWSHEILPTEYVDNTLKLQLWYKYYKKPHPSNLKHLNNNIVHFYCSLTQFNSNIYLFSQLEVTPNFNENATPWQEISVVVSNNSLLCSSSLYFYKLSAIEWRTNDVRMYKILLE